MQKQGKPQLSGWHSFLAFYNKKKIRKQALLILLPEKKDI